MNSLPGPREDSPSENSCPGHPFLKLIAASSCPSSDVCESLSSEGNISLIGREQSRNVSLRKGRSGPREVGKASSPASESNSLNDFQQRLESVLALKKIEKWQLFSETKNEKVSQILSSPLLAHIKDSQSMIAMTENPRSSRGSFLDPKKDSQISANPLILVGDLKRCYNFEPNGSKFSCENSALPGLICIEKDQNLYRPELIKLLKALVESQEQFELSLENFTAEGIEPLLIKNWIRENYFEKKNMGFFVQLEKILELPFEEAMKALVEAKILLKCRQKRPICALKSLMVLLLSKMKQPKISNHFSQFPGTDRLSEKHIMHLIGQEPLRSKLQAELANPQQIIAFCLNEFERKFDPKIRLWISNAASAHSQAEFFPGSDWRLRFRMKMRMRLVPIDISPSLEKLRALMSSKLSLRTEEM